MRGGCGRALRARPDVDPDGIVLAGASVDGSTVAYALGAQPDLPARGGVGFSAVEGPREVALSKRHAFRPHDLLLISGHRETQSARNLRARRARQRHNDLRRRDDRPRRRAAARRERVRPRDRLAQAPDGLNPAGVAAGDDVHVRDLGSRCEVQAYRADDNASSTITQPRRRAVLTSRLGHPPGQLFGRCEQQTGIVDVDHPAMAHHRLEYRHALRGIAYLRMLARERSPRTPIGGDRWGNELIGDYPPIDEEELE
jgi:hypothetical protein